MSDINLQKHCNNISDETGRFSLAKNSFDLLLPNDNFIKNILLYNFIYIVLLS